MGSSILGFSVLERGSQQSAAHAEAAARNCAIGGVAGRDGVAIDDEGGARAEGRRVIGALGRRGHDARECGSDEARGRSGVVFLRQATASHGGARRAGPAERADGLSRAADVGREPVLGAAVGRDGRSGDAVGDDELEPGDNGVRAEDDLRD